MNSDPTHLTIDNFLPQAKHSMHSASCILNAELITTPLGPMLALADSTSLYLLEFVERIKLQQNIQQLTQILQATIVTQSNSILEKLNLEIDRYFENKLTHFKTPVRLIGTPFQKQVWQTLQTIPYSETFSYAKLAQAINQPTAYRAVAQANSRNRLAIIVPCHRVINSDGKLGGYAGGVRRKQALLNIENINKSKG